MVVTIQPRQTSEIHILKVVEYSQIRFRILLLSATKFRELMQIKLRWTSTPKTGQKSSHIPHHLTIPLILPYSVPIHTPGNKDTQNVGGIAQVISVRFQTECIIIT